MLQDNLTIFRKKSCSAISTWIRQPNSSLANEVAETLSLKCKWHLSEAFNDIRADATPRMQCLEHLKMRSLVLPQKEGLEKRFESWGQFGSDMSLHISLRLPHLIWCSQGIATSPIIPRTSHFFEPGHGKVELFTVKWWRGFLTRSSDFKGVFG